jgi:hypothetical protein
MNWRRGTFRLWVFASAVWATVVIASRSPHLLDQVKAEDFFGRPDLPYWTQVVSYLHPNQLYAHPDLVGKPAAPDYALDASWLLVVARICDLILVIAVPSLVALVALIGARWVTMGFARSN